MQEADKDFSSIVAQVAAMPTGKVRKHNLSDEAIAAGTERLLKAQDRRYQFGGDLVRKCKHCGHPAVKGREVCRYHGGKKVEGRPPWRMFSRFMVKMIRLGRLPAELTGHPCWPAVCRVMWKKDYQEPLRALVIAACELADGDETARTRFVQAVAGLRKAGLTW